MQHPEEAENEAWIYNGQGEVPPTVRRVKIELAQGVSKIPESAFQRHQELGEVILSSSVQVIGRRAFFECRKLKSILYQGLEKEEVGIPSTVKVIEDSAFDTCTRLEELIFNEGLKRIGQGAFNQCESLTEVEIPSTVKVIGNSAFLACKLLKRLGLNEGLERIGALSFSECESLTEAEIPSTVKKIPFCAFEYCKHLARLGLNEGLEEIGGKAFSRCYSLSHVRIPQFVNSVARTAFVRCSSLISIELPEEWSFNIDLSECRSLVSLAGPISITGFFQSSKLGSLVHNEGGLKRKLNDRFDNSPPHSEAQLKRKLNHRFVNSPLNKLCYYQSYHSYENAMARLRSLMDENPLAATTIVDKFGMTPLHILSLSQTSNVDMLLLAVMKGGQRDHIIYGKDLFESTPMDYLCLNRMPTSTEVIRRVLNARFAQLLLIGLDRSLKSEMLQAIDKALAVDWRSRRREVVAIYLKLAKYDERQEVLCLLELHLWKTKIDKCTAREETVDQEFCRVNSGASIVLRHVQPFLDELDVKLDVEAYFVSYPDQFEERLEEGY